MSDKEPTIEAVNLDDFCLACEGDISNPDHFGCSFCGICTCEGGC